MRSRSAWSPFFGATLVCILAIWSIRTYQNGNYRTGCGRLASSDVSAFEFGPSVSSNSTVSNEPGTLSPLVPCLNDLDARHLTSREKRSQSSSVNPAESRLSSERSLVVSLRSGFAQSGSVQHGTAQAAAIDTSQTSFFDSEPQARTSGTSPSEFPNEKPADICRQPVGSHVIGSGVVDPELSADVDLPPAPPIEIDLTFDEENQFTGFDTFANDSVDYEAVSAPIDQHQRDVSDWTLEEVELTDRDISIQSPGGLVSFDRGSPFEFASSRSSVKQTQSTTTETTEPEITQAQPENNESIAADAEPLNEHSTERSTAERSTNEPAANLPARTWPVPASIVAELEKLEQQPLTRGWAEQMHQLVFFLTQVETHEDSQAGLIFQQMNGQLDQADQYIRDAEKRADLNAEQTAVMARLKRLTYSFDRRLAIWRHVNGLAGAGYADIYGVASKSKSNVPIISASATRISFEGIDPSWHEYLYLDEASREFSSLNPSTYRQRTAARKVLARISAPSLTPEQRRFVEQSMDPLVIDQLKNLASEPPTLDEILTVVEYLESTPDGRISHAMNDVWQNLMWSDEPALNRLASEINTHYRNANVRVSVDARLMNRLIPQMPAMTEPISETMMGTQISGRSFIENKLRVQLIPDPENVHVNIETDGSVHSDTTASTSGFRIQNQGLARFRVFKRLMYGRQGISSEQSVASVSSDQQVVGMQSDYDNIPLVNRIARRIARDKIARQAPAAEEQVKQKIASAAQQKLESEVSDGLAKARQFMNANVLQPLVALDLEPAPVGMSTTADKIMARYRVAGRDQMASYTSRPADLPGALLNIQLHQSAVNNLMSRSELGGNTFTVEELSVQLGNIVGGTQLNVDQEAREARFTFATHDPIRVDFVDDSFLISMNLKSFQVGDGKTWRQIQVKSTYIPQVNGTSLVLVQKKPGISLKGRRLKLRDQIALRTIFGAVFKDEYVVGTLPENMLARLKSPDLGIAALSLQSGWLGVAFADLPRRSPQSEAANQWQSIGSRPVYQGTGR